MFCKTINIGTSYKKESITGPMKTLWWVNSMEARQGEAGSVSSNMVSTMLSHSITPSS